jgi:hypothetical protein
MILLMDGVKYEERPPDSEEALAKMVKEHSQDILGADSLYFDIRHKLTGASARTIPDAFAIAFSPNTWWVVEIGLSSHPIRAHIVDQLGGFIAALHNPNTRHRINGELATKLDQEIRSSPEKLATISRNVSGEAFRFLSDLVEAPPQIVVIIDKKVPELEDAIRALAIPPKVIEFATFCREAVGLPVHIHQFEPLVKKPVKQAEIAVEEGPNGRVELEVKRRLGHPFVPKRHLDFFPAPEIRFKVVSDIPEFEAYMSSAKSGVGHMHGKGIREWVKRHPQLPEDVRVVFTSLERHKRYRLSIQKA